MRTYLIYLLFWVVLMVLAVANGVLREGTYGNDLPELHAHQISTFTGAVVFGIAVWLLSRRWPPASSRQALYIGLTWLVLTLCFEFLFGHYVAGHSWSRLLQDYNMLAGRVWPLLLVWVTALPYIVFRAGGGKRYA